MPQRLRQTTAQDGHRLAVNDSPVLASHAEIAAIVAGRLGRGHAELLATPALQPDGGVVWSTPLAGAVVPAHELGDDDRRTLEQRAERMLGDMRGLAAQLIAEGAPSQMVGQMLERAARRPPGDWLYSVGGRPVLSMWGHGGTPEVPGAALPASPTSGGGAMPAAIPPAVPPGVTAVAGAAPPSRPWKRWLAWLLLALLLLALLFWGWKRCSAEPDAVDLSAQMAQAEAHNRMLEEEIAKRETQPNQFQCVPDAPPPPTSAPEPAASAPPPAAPPSAPSPPASAPDPIAELKKRIEAAKKDCNAMQRMITKEPLLQGAASPRTDALKQQLIANMAENCKEKLIQQAKNLCPGQRPPELAPEMVIVFDASGSMDYSLDASEAQIQQAQGAMERAGPLGALLLGPAMQALYREPKRITSAKQATLAVVQKVPSDANIGLVLVDECPAARSQGYYAPAQRGSLVARIQGIAPRQGTPLADGIAKAGQMLDGVNRESLMLVVSDGRESCDGDPCAQAAALARAKPHLRINVVDITGTGAGNCVAGATGGKVFTARNADEVASMMKQAAAEAMGPANCKAN